MEASLVLIENYGLQGFNLTDATKAVGVSNGAAYRHFENREDLLADIATEGFRRFGDALEAAFGDPEADPFLRMERLGIAYVNFAVEHAPYFRVMFKNAVDNARYPQLKEAGHRGFSYLLRAAEAVAPEASPSLRDTLVVSCWSLVHGFAELEMEKSFDLVGDLIETTERVRNAIRLVMGGLPVVVPSTGVKQTSRVRRP